MKTFFSPWSLFFLYRQFQDLRKDEPEPASACFSSCHPFLKTLHSVLRVILLRHGAGLRKPFFPHV